VEATSAVWQLVLPVLVVVGGLIRLLFFIRRRRNPLYHGWQPAEVIALRSVVLVITGRPMTPITWKRIDVLLLVLLVLTVAAGLHDARDNSRHQSPLRHLFSQTVAARPLSPVK